MHEDHWFIVGHDGRDTTEISRYQTKAQAREAGLRAAERLQPAIDAADAMQVYLRGMQGTDRRGADCPWDDSEYGKCKVPKAADLRGMTVDEATKLAQAMRLLGGDAAAEATRRARTVLQTTEYDPAHTFLASKPSLVKVLLSKLQTTLERVSTAAEAASLSAGVGPPRAWLPEEQPGAVAHGGAMGAGGAVAAVAAAAAQDVGAAAVRVRADATYRSGQIADAAAMRDKSDGASAAAGRKRAREDESSG